MFLPRHQMTRYFRKASKQASKSSPSSNNAGRRVKCQVPKHPPKTKKIKIKIKEGKFNRPYHIFELGLATNSRATHQYSIYKKITRVWSRLIVCHCGLGFFFGREEKKKKKKKKKEGKKDGIGYTISLHDDRS